jgi:hypothetical protein
MINLAVYSTFCGSTKNKTFTPHPIESIYPHFFISNNEDILSESSRSGYTPIYLALKVSNDPVLSAHQAKIPKAVPHLIKSIAEFEFLFYKDDKIIINATRMGEFVKLLTENDSAMAVRPHPFLKGNILYEFGEAMLQSRYKSQWAKNVTYITKELANGANLECQMYATGAILRNMRHADTNQINATWLQHINRCGIECQISFDIIAQKFKSITLLPASLT